MKRRLKGRPSRRLFQWSGIVKVQRPLITNVPEPHVLVYSRDKRIMAQMTVSADDLTSIFKPGEFKVFMQAEQHGTRLTLFERAAWQEW